MCILSARVRYKSSGHMPLARGSWLPLYAARLLGTDGVESNRGGRAPSGPLNACTARCGEGEPMRTWPHERLLRRPQTKDSLRRRTRDVQDPSGPHLRREPLLCQTLREQSRPRGIAGTEVEPRLLPTAGREGHEATGGRPRRAPLCRPPGPLRLHTERHGIFGKPLHHVPLHSPHRLDPQKGGRSATERDEFRRAA